MTVKNKLKKVPQTLNPKLVEVSFQKAKKSGNFTVLRQLRSKHAWTLDRMGAALGCTSVNYRTIENGSRPVKKDVATQIAKVLRAPVSKLFKPFPKNDLKLIARHARS